MARRGRDVAHAMHRMLGVGSTRHAAAAASLLAVGMGCGFDFGGGPYGGAANPCADISPPPPNSTTTTDSNGCTIWQCSEGYYACGGDSDCGTDLLGDASNCGACGHSCGGGHCVEGSCSPLRIIASDLTNPGDVTVYGSDVYLATGGIGAIVRVPKLGGPSFAWYVLDSYSPSQVALAVDASGVYWFDGASLRVIPTGAEVAYTLAPDLGMYARPLFADGKYVYGMQLQGVLGDHPDGGIPLGPWRVPDTGGAVQPLAPLSQVWGYPEDEPFAIVTGKMAFADGERILAGPSDGSSMAVVAMQDSGVGALTADSAFIYWIAGASLGMERPGCSMGNAPYCMTYPSFDAGISDGLFAVSWSGGPVRTISKHGGLVDIRAAGNALWGILRGGQSSPDQLVKVDTASGQHAIVAGGGPIGGLAVDSTSVYFTRGTKLLSTPL